MNWYKLAQSSFYILGKKDDEIFMNNSWAAGLEKPGIRLNNEEIIYGDGSHWHVLTRAKPYIGNISNIESLGFVSFDGAWRSKITGTEEIKKYLNL